jgi:hypothetical protein
MKLTDGDGRTNRLRYRWNRVRWANPNGHLAKAEPGTASPRSARSAALYPVTWAVSDGYSARILNERRVSVTPCRIGEDAPRGRHRRPARRVPTAGLGGRQSPGFGPPISCLRQLAPIFTKRIGPWPGAGVLATLSGVLRTGRLQGLRAGARPQVYSFALRPEDDQQFHRDLAGVDISVRDAGVYPALDCAGVSHAEIIGRPNRGDSSVARWFSGSGAPCDVITYVVESSEIGESVQNLKARCARF